MCSRLPCKQSHTSSCYYTVTSGNTCVLVPRKHESNRVQNNSNYSRVKFSRILVHRENLSPAQILCCVLKGGRVMIAFFVNYSTVAFPLHLPTLKRQQFFGAVANSLGKKFIFPATVGRAALYGAQPVKGWMLAKGE